MANKFDHLTATERASAPATPDTSDWKIYFKSDGLYVVDDAGTETGPLGTGGGGSCDLVQLDEVELGSAQASISFSSIAGTYRDLLIVGELRSDSATTSDGISVRVGNGTVDTGANYRYSRTSIDQAAAAAEAGAEAQTIWSPGFSTAASADTGVFGQIEMTLLKYADATRRRGLMSRFGQVGDATDFDVGGSTGVWMNTASAIDIVTVFPINGTNFVAGSYLTLYGRG